MSKDRIENLPFTTYDLVGYLTPGSLVVLGIFWHPWVPGQQLLAPFISNGSILIQIIGFFSVFVAAYVAGHLVSYLSSEISEKFIVRTMGYPIRFMLRQRHKNVIEDKRECWQQIKKTSAKNLFPKNISFRYGNWFTHLIFLFHVFLSPAIVASKFLLGFGFYTEPLAKGIVTQCERRFKANWPHLKKSYDPSSEEWFHLVEHYTINQYPEVAPKAYNYVVLYGLLRSLFFLATLFTWFVAIQCFVDVGLTTLTGKFQGTLPLLSAVVLISWILGMAYCKFYRRYSREIISRFAATYCDQKNNT
ncbi:MULTISPECIES: hypothetical protein [Kordiimonas]|uniref:hypothetical protein n=1 Tax=Kordiimonas TaxID=288021 RepID=UPI00257C328E|nr:hypothetical protein [Kordiimonas sp. UBA4487]